VARPQSQFVCQSCGAAVARWEGQCRTCGEWNTLVETRVATRPARAAANRIASAGSAAGPVRLADLRDVQVPRITTGIGEFDRVTGGGIVPGSLVLIGGEPGIGKSTLLLQAAAGVARTVAERGGHVLYATAEEAAAQVHLRALRLGLADGLAGDGIHILAERDIERIVDHARADRPALVVVDSIQTVALAELEGPAGSVGQVRESAAALIELAKAEGIAVVLVGHVTKDGTLAGPKTLEHLVDAVLQLEGDRSAVLRILRATKNRFGSTDEIGVFEMAEAGLAEVDDPSRAFLAEPGPPAPGSVVAAVLEGSRPLLVEVQALVAPAGYGTPARRGSGLDPNRLAVLIAVLGRRAGTGLGSHDVYANLAGGLSAAEPALDLPLALALASSLRDRPIPAGLIAIGEVGLLGEIRPVPGIDRRLREAERLGLRRAIVPAAGRSPATAPAVRDGLQVQRASTLREAISLALDGVAEGGAVEGGSPPTGGVASGSRRC
jgi:DNA repair protein RadA/Sms